MLISRKLNLNMVAVIFLFSMKPCEAALTPFTDLLIWEISEQTSSIWSNITTTPASNVYDYRIQNTDFDWQPGLRVGFLYEPEQKYWDSRLYWTYFSTDRKYKLPAYGQIISPGFFSSFLSLDTFFGVDFDWRIAINMLDYNISHEFPVTDGMSLRPSIGVKAGTIHQHIHVDWDADVYGATEKVKNNFSGIGPTFGMDLKWNFFRNFLLIGNLSGAFMWGNWKVSDMYNRPGALLGIITPTTITTDLNDAKLGTIMFNYFLGLEWFYRGRSDLSLQLGYEMQFWPNQVRLTMFQQLPTHGDLTLQGATCRIHINL